MKKLLSLAALAMIAVPVIAGDCASTYACHNQCPLAQAANTHRSYGSEAAMSSAIVRADLTETVTANLARI